MLMIQEHSSFKTEETYLDKQIKSLCLICGLVFAIYATLVSFKDSVSKENIDTIKNCAEQIAAGEDLWDGSNEEGIVSENSSH